MKLVHAQQADDLQCEIKRRFTEFNRSGPPSQGRRYPRELKELICQAGVQGVKPAILVRLTGLSTSAVTRWLATAAPAPVAARRLAVVDTSPPREVIAPIIVRLPSGVTLELSDGRSLNSELLAALNTLEVRHAASR